MTTGKVVRSFDQHKLKLGLFGLNCSGGLSATLVPERWEGTWTENLAIAKMADDAGLDFYCRLVVGRVTEVKLIIMAGV